MTTEGWVYLTKDGYYVRQWGLCVRSESAAITEHQTFVSNLDEATVFNCQAPIEDEFESIRALKQVTVRIILRKVV